MHYIPKFHYFDKILLNLVKKNKLRDKLRDI